MLLLLEFEAEFWLKHTSSLKKHKRDCSVRKNCSYTKASDNKRAFFAFNYIVLRLVWQPLK